MGKIKQEINHFIESLQNQGINIKFCSNFLLEEQRGQTCKIVAGAMVQKYLYATNRHSRAPLPALKNHQHTASLRQRAKVELNSKVGEIYGPKQMKKLFEYADYSVSSFYVDDREQYIQMICNALQQDQPVIVYFDVKLRGFENEGLPLLEKGQYEHAAVVVGYYHQENEIQFILAQWNAFYTVSSRAVYDSTCQLALIKERENFRKYAPIPDKFDRYTWCENSQMLGAIRDASHHKLQYWAFSTINFLWPKPEQRYSQPPIGRESSFANIVTVIKGDQMHLDLSHYDQFDIEKMAHKQAFGY